MVRQKPAPTPPPPPRPAPPSPSVVLPPAGGGGAIYSSPPGHFLSYVSQIPLQVSKRCTGPLKTLWDTETEKSPSDTSGQKCPNIATYFAVYQINIFSDLEVSSPKTCVFCPSVRRTRLVKSVFVFKGNQQGLEKY